MKKLSFFIALFLLSGIVKSQIYSPVKWSYAAKKLGKNEAMIYVKATIEEDWHLYSVNQKPGGPLKTTFKFLPSTDFIISGKVSEPMPISKFDKTFGIQVDYFKKEVVFMQKIKLKKPDVVVKGKVEFMVCTDESCMPPAEVEFSIPVK